MEYTHNQIEGLLATTNLNEEKKDLVTKYFAKMSQPGQLRVLRMLKANRSHADSLVSILEELDRDSNSFQTQFETLVLDAVKN